MKQGNERVGTCKQLAQKSEEEREREEWSEERWRLRIDKTTEKEWR